MARSLLFSASVVGILLLCCVAVSATATNVTYTGEKITITQPGTYILTNDITNSSKLICIEIQASNVVFDGAGHVIDGTDAENSAGIYVHGPSMAVSVRHDQERPDAGLVLRRLPPRGQVLEDRVLHDLEQRLHRRRALQERGREHDHGQHDLGQHLRRHLLGRFGQRRGHEQRDQGERPRDVSLPLGRHHRHREHNHEQHRHRPPAPRVGRRYDLQQPI